MITNSIKNKHEVIEALKKKLIVYLVEKRLGFGSAIDKAEYVREDVAEEEIKMEGLQLAILKMDEPKFGKWFPNWEGPYMILKVVGRGAYQLHDKNDGLRHSNLVNGPCSLIYALNFGVDCKAEWVENCDFIQRRRMQKFLHMILAWLCGGCMVLVVTRLKVLKEFDRWHDPMQVLIPREVWNDVSVVPLVVVYLSWQECSRLTMPSLECWSDKLEAGMEWIRLECWIGME
ncbi:hypothetical protein FNV43_RR04507 [Rhamnella rubrinervis]|uniref:Uncharacterized protein n=1 Tax=Rhamnella rubrinervis TaxID=2594499 RepID=A0A8K0HKE1_9ROSA|nr:hypothetical protein FNV43_RR04507 [Rhamnella rubrinervis]